MELKYADLHIHSYYSDGTSSPETILKRALDKNLGLISITDHNVLDGSKKLRELCKGKDIRFVSGVELDSLYNGTDIHILGYGVSLEDKAFSKFVANNLAMLNQISDKLILKMQKVYKEISFEEYERFIYARQKGGWRALHYILSKGLSESLKDGLKYYNQFECGYDCVPFPSIDNVCDAIHKAGGKAVLAHPGKVIKTDDLDKFRATLMRIIDMGIDGIECYYPSHTKEVCDICLKICEDIHLAVTAGSDYHGDFSGEDINYMKVSADKIIGI